MSTTTLTKQDILSQGRLLTVKQVLEMWPFSRQSLTRWTALKDPSRRIPSYKVWGRRVYKYDELMFWLDNFKE